MRIAIDARFYGLENAGLGRYTVKLLEELTKIDSKNKYFILLREKYYDTLKFPSNWEKVLAEAKHYSLQEQIVIPKILKKINPDFTHFLHFNVPISYSGPFIVTIHDLIMHRSRDRSSTTLPPFLFRLKRIGYNTVFSHAVKSAKHIIVPTHFVQDEVIKHYNLPKEKVSVTYEGVDFNPKVVSHKYTILKKYKIDSPYFIYTGNAYPHKNLPRAIEAVVHLNKASDQKIIFALVGSRDVFKSRLKNLIIKYNAENFVKLLGFVPDEDLAVLYKSSLGFVYPSLYEGFGLPALEAMSQGTIALVSEIPVFKEVYGKSAIYFNPYDFTSIQKTLESVIKMDMNERVRLAKTGLAQSKLYKWSIMAHQTLEVYNSIYEKA